LKRDVPASDATDQGVEHRLQLAHEGVIGVSQAACAKAEGDPARGSMPDPFDATAA
jgi:hypothetical protein